MSVFDNVKMLRADAIDQDKSDQGIWKEYVTEDGHAIEFLIASAGNKKFQKYFEKIKKPYARQFRDGSVSEEISERLYCQALAKHILLDWKGIDLDDGTALAATYENKFDLLSHPQFTGIRSFIIDVCVESANYKVGVVEESVKNSKKS